MGLPVKRVDQDCADGDSAGAELAWGEGVRRRVEQIRSGTAGRELRAVLAELDRCEAELGDCELDDLGGDVDDPAVHESAWADEIQARLREIEEGTVPTYAVEDVMAALRVRFG